MNDNPYKGGAPFCADNPNAGNGTRSCPSVNEGFPTGSDTMHQKHNPAAAPGAGTDPHPKVNEF